MPVPPRRKKVTQQTLPVRRLALIAGRVNQMGYLWHDRRVDHGIDGEIELISPDSSPLNVVVMVQSEATAGPSLTRLGRASSGPRTRRTWMTGSAGTPR